MMEKLRVEGMHCDACIALVKMEIEEAGVDPVKVSIRVDGLNNTGEVAFTEILPEEKVKVIDAINSMEGYQVV